MERLLKQIKVKAKKEVKTIVFPEGSEERILKATEIIVKEKLAKIILLGNPQEILSKANKLKLNIKDVQIIDNQRSDQLNKYAKTLYELRKTKGMNEEEAKEKIKDCAYFGTMMVKLNQADGLVSGAVHSTAHTLRPALQIIKTKGKFHRVSGVFLMFLKKKVLFFADSAVEIEPDAKDLAEIAIDTAETARTFGILPKVAMLSFSTHGSAKHPLASKVKEAVEIVRYKRKNLTIDGELQVDAAISPEVAKLKAPTSILKGNANILIFPDIQSGNISYKLVERLGHAKAVGPVLQGINKPINDLSRGCSVEDIVNITAITAVQAQKAFHKKHIKLNR